MLFMELECLRLVNKFKFFICSIQVYVEFVICLIDWLQESWVQYIYEFYIKYSMVLVCFIFVFIGVFMGVIVCKGGFGYFILIFIIFFMVFIVLIIFCCKIVEFFVFFVVVVVWVFCIVFFFIGVLLICKVMNDSKLVNIDQYVSFFKVIINLFKK